MRQRMEEIATIQGEGDRPNMVREERMESKTDCKAKINVLYDVHYDVWRVRKIINDHNYDMVPVMFVTSLPVIEGWVMVTRPKLIA
ncbi:hypothetical protein PIB30_043913 [Stylosanthes scabra]|uniref:FAR1 domain-containing protein n=1 Tax=Stylosanthes scabra TaxID=79078 RepID=A0ABU6UG76_9FABA|nr:hypothetical protein [Stylosanthes scabra]